MTKATIKISHDTTSEVLKAIKKGDNITDGSKTGNVVSRIRDEKKSGVYYSFLLDTGKTIYAIR